VRTAAAAKLGRAVEEVVRAHGRLVLGNEAGDVSRTAVDARETVLGRIAATPGCAADALLQSKKP